MARSLDEIIEHADQLAAFIKSDDFNPEMRDAWALRELFAAAEDRSAAEARVDQAVTAARGDGYSWGLIGMALGTSGEAARQRYAHRGACGA
jgi:hypothetical protein